MNILDCDQQTGRWLEIKREHPISSSRISSVLNFRKDGQEGDKRRKLKLEILQELITGRSAEHYVTPAMEFGRENEPRARAEYEYIKGVTVELIGFVAHPTLDRCGCSPDGFVAPNRFLEIKVPTIQTHLEYLAAGVVPAEYIPQMQWQMGCAEEIEVNDFVSFQPELPEELQMFIMPLERDAKKIAHYEEQATIFLEEVINLWEQIKRGAKGYTLEDKLRASIRQSRGQFPYEAELEITKEDIRA